MFRAFFFRRFTRRKQVKEQIERIVYDSRRQVVYSIENVINV